MSSAPSNTASIPRKKSRTTLYIVLGVVLVAGIVAAAVMKGRSAQKGTLVTTEKAVVKTITQLVSATGKIQPEVEVKISPEVAGEIIQLPFREGAQVKKGDLVIKIKPDNYRYQLDQREANLSAAKATAVLNKSQLAKAEEDHKRNADLFSRQRISELEHTASKTAYEVARATYENSLAQIRSAEGLLKQAQDQLEKTTLYAPIDGSVSALTSEVGERVVATGQFSGTEVMRIANLDEMEVRVNVNENDVVNVKVNDRARITIDAFPNRKFTGYVKEIASTAKTAGLNTQEEVTNFQVKIRIAAPGVALRPGMSANADIETKTVENVVSIPIQAVTVRSRTGSKTVEELAADREKDAKAKQGDGAAVVQNEREQREREKADRDQLQRVVFLRDGDKVKQVVVETGIADTAMMEIKSGLKVGDEVVTGPFSTLTRNLKDGSNIRLETAKEKAAKAKPAAKE